MRVYDESNIKTNPVLSAMVQSEMQERRHLSQREGSLMFYVFKEEKCGQSKGEPAGQRGRLRPDHAGHCRSR